MAKRLKQRKLTTRRERAQALKKQAMPEVLRLVKRYGRTTISGCLIQIKKRDREAARLAALKKEVTQLERGLR